MAKRRAHNQPATGSPIVLFSNDSDTPWRINSYGIVLST